MIFKNKSLIGIQLLFFVFLSLISCTTKTPNNSKKELYPSGKIKSEIPLNEGKENGLGIYYYESGSIKAWINKKDDLKNGLV
jgi:antitoxin component YwqK of YwqJK toxin-antitoxin module